MDTPNSKCTTRNLNRIELYGQQFELSLNHPDMLAIPARGQLNRENDFLPVPVRTWLFDFARRVRSSRPAQACLFSTLRLNLVLTHGIPPTFCHGVQFYHQPPSGQSRVYGITQVRNQWHLLPRVPWHRPSTLKGNSSNGCCLFRFQHGSRQRFKRPSFSCAHYYYCDIQKVLEVAIYDKFLVLEFK